MPVGRIAALCAATLVAVVVLRLLWVFPARYLLVRPGPDPATGQKPPAAYTFILGWAGMRGVVTLAAAFVIPEEAPYREILLMIAFTVVAATLLQQASKAGFARLDEFEHDDHHGVHDLIRQRIDQRNFAALERIGTVADEETPASSTPGSGSRSRRNARGCWRSAAAAPSPPTWSPRCSRCSTSRSRCVTSRPSPARSSGPPPREQPPRRGVCRPRAVPRDRDAERARLRRVPA